MHEIDDEEMRHAPAPGPKDTPLVALAKLVIETLEGQKRYFKSRSQVDLIASKQREAQLAKMAAEMIAAPKGGGA